MPGNRRFKTLSTFRADENAAVVPVPRLRPSTSYRAAGRAARRKAHERRLRPQRHEGASRVLITDSTALSLNPLRRRPRPSLRYKMECWTIFLLRRALLLSVRVCFSLATPAARSREPLRDCHELSLGNLGATRSRANQKASALVSPSIKQERTGTPCEWHKVRPERTATVSFGILRSFQLRCVCLPFPLLSRMLAQMNSTQTVDLRNFYQCVG
jgi:hypothetical protein